MPASKLPKWTQLRPLDENEGKEGPPEFPQRLKSTATLVYPHVFIIGGRTKFGQSKEIVKINLETQEWCNIRQKSQDNPAFEGHSACYFQDRHEIYVFGGSFSTSSSPLWKYDIAGNSMSRLPRVIGQPTSRRGHSMVLFMNKLFIFGGFIDIIGSTNQLWIYDFTVRLPDSPWICIVSDNSGVPCARLGHSCVIFNGCMWIYGGRKDLSAPMGELWKYQIEDNKWSQISRYSNPGPLFGHSACVSNGKMFIFGGESIKGGVNTQLWCFSFDSESFTRLSFSLPSPFGCVFGQLISLDCDPSQGRPLSHFLQKSGGYRPSLEGTCPLCKFPMENESKLVNIDTNESTIVRHSTQSSADSGFQDNSKLFNTSDPQISMMKLERHHSENGSATKIVNYSRNKSTEPLIYDSIEQLELVGNVNLAFQGSALTIAEDEETADDSHGSSVTPDLIMNLPGSIEEIYTQQRRISHHKKKPELPSEQIIDLHGFHRQSNWLNESSERFSESKFRPKYNDYAEVIEMQHFGNETYDQTLAQQSGIKTNGIFNTTSNMKAINECNHDLQTQFENETRNTETPNKMRDLCNHANNSCQQMILIGGKFVNQSVASGTSGLYEPLSVWLACQTY